MHMRALVEDSVVVVRLLDLVADDIASRRRRHDDDYVSLFPGHEAVVRRELAAIAGATDASSAQDELVIAGYRVIEQLGAGGQAVVYLARDPVLPRNVALKVQRSPTPPTPVELLRWQREVQVTSRLEHPGICPVYNGGVEGSTLWLAMRHLEGESLDKRLAREVAEGLLPTTSADIRQRVALLVQVCGAVQAAHAHGLVHRDIKPGNIFVTPNGQPVLLDFGLALERDSTLTADCDRLGSPVYMSPEQVAGEPVDARADVWALGLVLHEMLTHQRAFQRHSREATLRAIEREATPGVRTQNRVVPRDVEVVIATALEREPSRRYESVHALAADLQAFLDARPIRARPASAWMRCRRWVKREPVRALGLAALLAVCTLSGFLWSAVDSVQRERRATARDAAWEQLAECYLELGEGSPTRAAALVDELSGLLGAEVEWQFAALAARLDLGQRERARSDLQAWLGAGAHPGLARIERLIDAEALPDDEPVDAMDAFVAGSMALHRVHRGDAGARARAVQMLELAVRLAPQAHALYEIQLLDAAGHAERHDVARVSARALGLHWPKSPSVLLLAADDPNRALSVRPNFTLARRVFARQLGAAGNHPDAVRQLERVVELDPVDPVSQREFAESLLRWAERSGAQSKAVPSGDRHRDALLDRARAALDASERLAPNEAATHSLRIELLRLEQHSLPS